MFRKIHLTSSLLIALSSAHPAFAIPQSGHEVMIAAPSRYAVDAGKKIYLAGGSLADVAIEVDLMLAVTAPYFGSLGGGGFAVLHLGDKNEALDFREKAPAKATADLYKDQPERASLDGGLAVGVPGIPRGLWALHKKYGKLPWKKLFDEPIRFAREGFRVSGEWVDDTSHTQSRFNPAGIEILFKKGGVPYQPGEILKQPKLAKLLEKLAHGGADAFYKGDVAKDIVQTVAANKGIITNEDMENYQERWLEPLDCDFQGYKLHMMPPPSSGGVVVCTALKLAQKTALHEKKYLSIDELTGLGKILKLAFYSRNSLGDPDFVNSPIAALLGDEYIGKLALLTQKPPNEFEAAFAKDESQTKEHAETTHFSIMDHAGHAIAMTVTLNGRYGSGLLTDKFGLALNNEMDDFNTRPGTGNLFHLIQGKANEVGAGRRPLSSMSPTLIEKDGQIVMAVGAPGGPRIISAVFQTIYRKLVSGLNVDEAIQAPRLHHQFAPDKLYVDFHRLPPETIAGLTKAGFTVEEGWMGRGYAVSVETDEKTGIKTLEGAYDARGEGDAGGF